MITAATHPVDVVGFVQGFGVGFAVLMTLLLFTAGVQVFRRVTGL